MRQQPLISFRDLQIQKFSQVFIKIFSRKYVHRFLQELYQKILLELYWRISPRFFQSCIGIILTQIGTLSVKFQRGDCQPMHEEDENSLKGFLGISGRSPRIVSRISLRFHEIFIEKYFLIFLQGLYWRSLRDFFFQGYLLGFLIIFFRDSFKTISRHFFINSLGRFLLRISSEISEEVCSKVLLWKFLLFPPTIS